MSVILYISPYILSVFSYLIPICYFLPFKLKLKEKIIFFFLLLINIFLIICYLGNVGVIFLLISSGIYISLLDRNHLLNICIFITTYLFCVLWDNIFSLLWDTFVFPISSLQNSYKYYTLYLFSYLLLLTVLCRILFGILRNPIRRLHTRLSKQLLVLIITNLAICLFIFLFNIVIGEYVGYNRKIIAFNCILFGCYFFISTILIINIVKTNIVKMEIDMRKDAYDRLQDYTNQIENMYSSLRSFKHDYLNIMLSMSGYIEVDDMTGLRNYFDKEIIPLNKKLSINTAHLNQLMNIKIIELKGLISAKLLYATELNITVSVEITEEISDIPMDIIDLSRILGIYLDNAIEATLETTSPIVQFAIINMENEYVFIVSNTFIDTGIPSATLQQPTFSTKGANRGIGLYNAHEIITKYHYVFWDTETDDLHFTQRLRILKTL